MTQVERLGQFNKSVFSDRTTKKHPCYWLFEHDSANCDYWLSVVPVCRDRLLSQWFPLLAECPLTPRTYEDGALLRDRAAVHSLCRILQTLNEFSVTLEAALVKGVDLWPWRGPALKTPTSPGPFRHLRNVTASLKWTRWRPSLLKHQTYLPCPLSSMSSKTVFASGSSLVCLHCEILEEKSHTCIRYVSCLHEFTAFTCPTYCLHLTFEHAWPEFHDFGCYNLNCHNSGFITLLLFTIVVNTVVWNRAPFV